MGSLFIVWRKLLMCMKPEKFILLARLALIKGSNYGCCSVVWCKLTFDTFRHARAERVYRLEFVSNQEFSEKEFEAWKARCDKDDVELPTVEEVCWALFYDDAHYACIIAHLILTLGSKLSFKHKPSCQSSFRWERHRRNVEGEAKV